MVKPRKLANGSWVIQPTVKLPNGIVKRSTLTAKTREAVVAKLRRLQEQESQGISCIDKEWRVGEYLDYWLYKVQRNKIKESTLVGYENLINKHLKPALGGHRLKELNVENVQHGIDTIIDNGYAGAVANKSMQVLITCLNHAIKERKIIFNAASLVGKPTYKPKERVVWTAEQAALFLETNREHPLYIAFLLAMTYGMRRGEVLALRWSDIDFVNERIYIRQQVNRVRGVLKVSELKTDSSFRDIPLDPAICDALLQHAKKNNVDIPPFNPSFQLSLQGTVITSKASTPMEPRNFLRCFQILSLQGLRQGPSVPLLFRSARALFPLSLNLPLLIHLQDTLLLLCPSFRALL